ncbi:MAG TPA: hypothetical protein VF042_07010 [Gemmatimonadaceae bacterium]
MTLFLYLLRQLAAALVTFAPSLWWNVTAVAIGYALVAACGHALISTFHRDPAGRQTIVADKADWLLTSFTAGTLYTLLLMYALGTAGLFRSLAVWIGILLPIVAALMTRRFTIRLTNPVSQRIVLVIALVALGPLIVSLTCPVPSWGDVLDANVAPVQRLLTFGSYDPATALPSALYPLNRATPLFTSFHAVVAALFGLRAYEELAAALVPTLMITLLGAYRLARILAPEQPLAGVFAILAWPLSYNYLHLQDSRSTGWQMVFALIALAKAIELLGDSNNHRIMFACASAVAAAILVHPFEGVFTVMAVLPIIVMTFLKSGKRARVDYLISAGIALCLAISLIWTWYPENAATGVVTVGALVGAIALLVAPRANSSIKSETGLQSGVTHGGLRFAPLLILLSTLILRWDFYGFGRRSFLLHQMIRYPVPTGLSVVAILISLSRLTRTSLLVGVSLLAASVPLWILPLLSLTPVQAASFRYEFPLKGLDFWLSGISCATAAVVMTTLWTSQRRRRLARIFVAAIIVLPTALLFKLPNDAEHKAAGLIGMTRWHLKLAATGYWRGWGDPRFVVTKDERDIFDKLLELVRSGRIKSTDRIAHVAPASNLRATPFPAFTGISQNLYLPEVAAGNVHTTGGRLFDLRNATLPSGWILVERAAEQFATVNDARVIYANDRALLLYRR